MPVYSDLHKCNFDYIATWVVDTNRHFLNHTEIGSLYIHSLIKLMGFPTCMWCHCGHVDFIIHVQGDSDHTAVDYKLS